MMITFAEFQYRLVEHLRFRIRNGELTERGLARRIGLSQPHIHNVLKGVRSLSPDVGDQLLVHLRISLIDLLDPAEIGKHTTPESDEHYESCYIPVLSDPIGPHLPWPKSIDRSQRFLVERKQIAAFTHPVVGKLGHDPRMFPAIQSGDFALLDQSYRARRFFDPDALYLVKQGAGGLIRRARLGGTCLYLVTEDALDTPSEWQKISLTSQDAAHVIRARVQLVAPDRDPAWDESGQDSATSR